MSNDPNDRILDSFMEEMLAEEKPSKRPEEILRAVQVQRHRNRKNRKPVELASSNKPLNARAQQIRRWKMVSVICTVVVLGVSVGIVALMLDPQFRNQFRQAEENNHQDPVENSDPKDENSLVESNLPEKIEKQNATFENPLPQNLLPDSPLNGIQNSESSQLVQSTEIKPVDRSSFQAKTTDELSQAINTHLNQLWVSTNTTPNSAIEDSAWIDRIADRIFDMKINDVDRIMLGNKIESKGRKATLSWLIQQDRYKEAFVDKWANVLANRLTGRSRRYKAQYLDSLVSYLKEQLRNERSWDELGYEVLNAKGTLKADSKDAHEASLLAVIINQNLGDRQRVGEAVSTHLTGSSISCARCHNEYSGQTKQKDYWSFQSCFLQLGYQKTAEGTLTIQNGDAIPNPGQANDNVAIFFEDREGVMVAAYPGYNGKTSSEYSGRLANFNRRAYLAQQIIESNHWHRAIVDHIWTEMMGDSLSGSFASGNQKQLVELHDTLTHQLVAHPSIARIIAAIALADCFSVGDKKDQTFEGEHLFASYHIPKLPVSVRTLSVLATVYRMESANKSAGLLARKFEIGPELKKIPMPDRAFLEAPRPRKKWAAPDEVAEILDKIEASKLSTENKLTHLYMLAQGQTPSQHELAAMKSIMAASADPSAALSDIWWTLINSKR